MLTVDSSIQKLADFKTQPSTDNWNTKKVDPVQLTIAIAPKKEPDIVVYREVKLPKMS